MENHPFILTETLGPIKRHFPSIRHKVDRHEVANALLGTQPQQGPEAVTRVALMLSQRAVRAAVAPVLGDLSRRLANVLRHSLAVAYAVALGEAGRGGVGADGGVFASATSPASVLNTSSSVAHAPAFRAELEAECAALVARLMSEAEEKLRGVLDTVVCAAAFPAEPVVRVGEGDAGRPWTGLGAGWTLDSLSFEELAGEPADADSKRRRRKKDGRRLTLPASQAAAPAREVTPEAAEQGTPGAAERVRRGPLQATQLTVPETPSPDAVEGRSALRKRASGAAGTLERRAMLAAAQQTGVAGHAEEEPVFSAVPETVSPLARTDGRADDASGKNGIHRRGCFLMNLCAEGTGMHTGALGAHTMRKSLPVSQVDGRGEATCSSASQPWCAEGVARLAWGLGIFICLC